MSGGVLFENRWEIILMRKIFAAAIFSAVLMISGMAAASEAEAVKLLNELRAEVGLPALAWDSQSKLQRARGNWKKNFRTRVQTAPPALPRLTNLAFGTWLALKISLTARISTRRALSNFGAIRLDITRT